MTIFYQAVLDALAINNDDADLLLLKKLCVALEKEDQWSTNDSARELIGRKLIDEDVHTLLYSIVHAIHLEILSRLVFLGQFENFRNIRSWYLDVIQIPPFSNRPFPPTKEELVTRAREEIWKDIVDKTQLVRLRQQFKSKRKIWLIWNLTIVGLLIEISYFMNNRSPKNASHVPNRSFDGDGFNKDNFYNYVELVSLVLWEIQIMVQHMLDEAKKLLETGNATKIAGLRKMLRDLDRNLSAKYLAAAFPTNTAKKTQKSHPLSTFSPRIKFTRTSGVKLIARNSENSSGGFYFDAPSLKQNSKNRKMEYNHYDREGESIDFPESFILHRHLLEARWRQTQFLLRVYGKLSEKELRKKQKDAIQSFVAKQKRPLSTREKMEIGSRDAMEGLRLELENARRQKILKSVPEKSRRLETDDDWIEYIVAVFKHDASEKIKKDDIWKNVLNDLSAYFFSFTGSTKFNLRDTGFSYLEIGSKLPRAITGQLLHDCGVYAVRLSYILLQAGHRIDAGKRDDDEKLALKIEFIVLPAHVGLIVKGKGLSSLVTQNGKLTTFSKEEVEKFEERWKNFDENGVKRKTPEKTINQTQFWAEIAAPFYISGVNLPYFIIKIPAAVPNFQVTKRRIWDTYKLVVCAPDRNRGKKCGQLFNPKYPEQFVLNYLNITEQEVKLINQQFTPIWNIDWFKAWHESKNELNAAFNDAKKTYANEKILLAKIEKFKDLRMDYINLLFLPINKIEKEQKALENAKESINLKLATEPNILVRGIQHTWAKRLNIDKGVLNALNGHLHNIDPPSNSLDDVNLEPPPFADENNKLIPTPM